MLDFSMEFSCGWLLQFHMERFAKMIVQKLKDEKLFASQGGPIILAQVLFSRNHQTLPSISHSFSEYDCFGAQRFTNLIAIDRE